MEGAARMLLDGVEGSSRAIRVTASEALDSAARVSSANEAEFLKLASSTSSQNVSDKALGDTLNLLMHESLDTATEKQIADLSKTNKKIIFNKNLFENITKEELNVLKIVAAKIEKKFPDIVLNSIQRFNKEETKELLSIFEHLESRIDFLNTTCARISVDSEELVDKKIVETLRNTAAREPTLSKLIEFVYKSSKYFVVGGSLAYCSSFVIAFMKHHSGPFLTSTSPERSNNLPHQMNVISSKNFLEKKMLKKRIRDPYPCGFSDKSGDVDHPLDSVIRSHVKQPCTDWRKYDLCGGWATVAPGSRLFSLVKHENLVHTLNKLNGSFLSCEDMTLGDAFVSFVHSSGHTVGNAIKEVVGSLAEGIGFNLSRLRSVLFVLAGVVVFYYSRKFTETKTKYSLHISVASGLAIIFGLFFVFS